MRRFSVLAVIGVAAVISAASLSCTNSPDGSPAKSASQPAAGNSSTANKVSDADLAPRKDLPVKPVGSATKPRSGGGSWMKLHESYVRRAKKGDINVIFFGDSITFGFSGHGFVGRYGQLQAVDFGINGDRTENVLWRVNNGEMEGLSPKLVVLLIGTNNLANNYTNQDVADGVGAIIQAIQAKSPATKILLLGIFPRWNDAEFREKIKQTNSLIARLADGQRVRYLDIGDKFLDKDGKLTKEIAGDFTHPTHRGYEIWAKNMDPVLYEMLGEPMPAK
jgi:lysophospholipase L1-like esterase